MTTVPLLEQPAMPTGLTGRAQALAVRYWGALGIVVFALVMLVAFVPPAHAARPVWWAATALAGAAASVWATSTVRAHAATGERPTGYPVAIALALVLLVVSLLVLAVVFALALQGRPL